ncbi:MAG TPA: hypothetical protein VMH88_03365 [Gemmatimonadales bacterium]|nr:hypothetical protein [Gemmatimonadales bacterium]
MTPLTQDPRRHAHDLSRRAIMALAALFLRERLTPGLLLGGAVARFSPCSAACRASPGSCSPAGTAN